METLIIGATKSEVEPLLNMFPNKTKAVGVIGDIYTIVVNSDKYVITTVGMGLLS